MQERRARSARRRLHELHRDKGRSKDGRASVWYHDCRRGAGAQGAQGRKEQAAPGTVSHSSYRETGVTKLQLSESTGGRKGEKESCAELKEVQGACGS